MSRIHISRVHISETLLKTVAALAVVLLATPLAWSQAATSQPDNSPNQHNAIQETIIVSQGKANSITAANTPAVVESSSSLSRRDELAILTVNVSHPTKVQSTVVAPGIYMMVVNGDQMTLQDLHTNKVIAQAPVSWTEANHRFDNTMLDVNGSDELTRIDVGGTDQAVVIQNPAPNGNATAPNAG